MLLNCGVAEDSWEFLACKEIKLVNPKWNQSCIFIGKNDAEAEIPILWPPDVKSWLIGKDLDAGKDWGQEEKVTMEDETVGWHHRHNEHGFGWTLGVGDGQGGLACCGSWGHKESDTTEQLNWTEPAITFISAISLALPISLALTREKLGGSWVSLLYFTMCLKFSISKKKIFLIEKKMEER